MKFRDDLVPIELWLNGEVDRDTIVEVPQGCERGAQSRRPHTRYQQAQQQERIAENRDSSDNTLFNLNPIDAYLLLWRPSVWYTDQGGWQAGFKAAGSFLGTCITHGLGIVQHQDNTVNYDATVSHSLFGLTPLSSIAARGFRLEGRTGASLSFVKELREHYSYPPIIRSRSVLVFACGKQGLPAEAANLGEGDLHRIIAGYEYSNRWEHWNIVASAHLESSTSPAQKSDFQYSKRTVQIRTWSDARRMAARPPPVTAASATAIFPADQVLLLHGISARTIPGAAPEEQGPLPSTVRDHALSPGGGFLRGYFGYGISGDKIDA